METYVMKKISYLFVLLAMVMLTGCNFENEPIIRYEVNADNPDESYVMEIFPDKTLMTLDEELTGIGTSYRKVRNGGKRYILGALLRCSGEDCCNELIYNMSLPKDNSSLVLTYKNERGRLSKDEFKSALDNYVKYSGITADTTYKPSYKITVADTDKFANATDVDQNIYMGTNFDTYVNDYSYYERIIDENQPKDIDDLVQSIWMLTGNLRTFHHIPVLHEKSAFKEIRIKIKPDFYSEPKSVEEVNEMLSEYGLSLVPTGEEMMVVTFSVKDEAVK